jgi:hypothetical protein
MATEFQRIFGEPVDFHALVSYLVYCFMRIELLFLPSSSTFTSLLIISACRSELYLEDRRDKQTLAILLFLLPKHPKWTTYGWTPITHMWVDRATYVWRMWVTHARGLRDKGF